MSENTVKVVTDERNRLLAVRAELDKKIVAADAYLATFGATTPRAPRNGTSTGGKNGPSEERQWLMSQGLLTSTRGRIPAELKVKYAEYLKLQEKSEPVEPVTPPAADPAPLTTDNGVKEKAPAPSRRRTGGASRGAAKNTAGVKAVAA